MKKSIYFILAIFFSVSVSKAQTAMQFSKQDCNGNAVDLFADLDAGKAVVLFFYMPNCGACPPPAQKIQSMGNNINADIPDLVKGYAFPFNNTTDCAASVSWATSSSVDHFYSAMDSGATMVAYYGGFGMPTVVLLGGTDHRVMFSTLSFSTSDTTIMRDSILANYSKMNGISSLPSSVSSFTISPNPASDRVSINLELKEASKISIDVTDISGNQVAVILDEMQSGIIRKQFPLSSLADGNYLIRLNANGKTVTRKLKVSH